MCVSCTSLKLASTHTSRVETSANAGVAALGQMASGIAHDINNALSPVALYTEALLEKEPGVSERGRGYLTTIQRAIEDVAETVSRMREFYRPRESQAVLAHVNINRLIEQVVGLTRARWSDQPQHRGIVIEVETELAAELPAISGAEAEIRDALTNLIFNAVDAMPEGGTLTVSTKMLTQKGVDGNEVGRPCVEVSDTGVGMSEETRKHCLEPFFTTKGERGTGLGLAMVYGMVQRHGGDLQIESEPGKGTTMRLAFPAAAAETVASVRAPELQSLTRRLRVLIVDDDPIVTESLRDSLHGDGHFVTTADGGRAGIRHSPRLKSGASRSPL
jgi:signal transduction histidine kinase